MKIVNKKAYHNYAIEDSFEAGIVLTGAEVKSIKSGRCNLSDAYVKFMGDELFSSALKEFLWTDHKGENNSASE